LSLFEMCRKKPGTVKRLRKRAAASMRAFNRADAVDEMARVPLMSMRGDLVPPDQAHTKHDVGGEFWTVGFTEIVGGVVGLACLMTHPGATHKHHLRFVTGGEEADRLCFATPVADEIVKFLRGCMVNPAGGGTAHRPMMIKLQYQLKDCFEEVQT
jgi:hypothetical protein